MAILPPFTISPKNLMSGSSADSSMVSDRASTWIRRPRQQLRPRAITQLASCSTISFSNRLIIVTPNASQQFYGIVLLRRRLSLYEEVTTFEQAKVAAGPGWALCRCATALSWTAAHMGARMHSMNALPSVQDGHAHVAIALTCTVICGLTRRAAMNTVHVCTNLGASGRNSHIRCQRCMGCRNRSLVYLPAMA